MEARKGRRMSQTLLLAKLKASLEASAGDVVFGMEDGTVSIFGLVFGVAATTNDQSAVLIAGASGAVAAAVSMMAGTYLDAETSQDQARMLDARTAADMKSDLGAVVGRITQRLQLAGLAHEQTAIASDFLSSQPAILRAFVMALADPAAGSKGSALVRSLWMLIADFLAAAIPILPFAFLPVPQGRVVSAVVTTLLLVALGVRRARIGGRNILRTVIETVLIGVAAALAGVGIGVEISRLFS
jgi:VIT1/CCC1 family predicted Fe2+/Mn2+ transporter